MTFLEWCRRHGLDPDSMDETTRKKMEDIHRSYMEELEAARRKEQRGDGGEARANAEQAQARSALILNTAQAMSATAADGVARGLLDYAADLVGDESVRAEDAQKKLADKARELAKSEPQEPAAAPAERGVPSLPSDPEAVLSRADIVSCYADHGDDRTLTMRAARSIVTHQQQGDELPLRALFADLKERDPKGEHGRLRVHIEDGGRPAVRALTAASANVAIQTVLTTLLGKVYTEHPPVTDQLVTTVQASADEVTFPEVEADEGVRRVREGDPYPVIGGVERSVKSSWRKYGAALTQTRESATFDQLGRLQVQLTSLARQLRNKRDMFRLARICDSTAEDGRYIARPGDDAGSSAFYSTSADHRGNTNLVESNGLADYTDIDADVKALEAMQLLDDSYVLPELNTILVPAALKATAWKIVNSLYCPPTGSDTANPMQVNPYGPQGMYSNVPRILSHPAVATYTGNSTTWFAGDPTQQFYEVEIWPVEVVPRMSGGEMALRDIQELWIGSFCIDVIALSNMFFLKNTV